MTAKTAEAPKTSEDKTVSEDKPKKKRTRKPEVFVLACVVETEATLDDDGNEIPGTKREAFVPMEFPPNMDEADKRSRDAIKRACRRAVYDDGLTEYGNRPLVVLKHDDIFQVEYERVVVSKLLPPKKAEKLRQEIGTDAVSNADLEVLDDDEEEPTTGTDSDVSDADSEA